MNSYRGELTQRYEDHLMWKRPINTKQSIGKAARICCVCGRKCSQLCRCMRCRRWSHVDCLTDGVCTGGCKQEEA